MTFLAALVAACSSSSTNETQSEDAGNSGGAAGATDSGSGGDALTAGQAGTTGDASEGDADACAPLVPIEALDATPTGGCGVTCAFQNVLLADGNFAGLDCVGAPGEQMLAGHTVTGCIVVDFGSVRSLDPVVFRLKAVPSACGGNCTSPDCGTGDQFKVFFGDSLGTYTYLNDFSISSTVSDFQVELGAPARFVVACRTGNGPPRDDVAIDAIWSVACP